MVILRSAAKLDQIAADLIAAHGAKPSFLDYHPDWAPVPYPGVICLSVNEVIVHGIPDRRPLRAGDLLSIDCGASVDGYHGDAAVTVAVGARASATCPRRSRRSGRAAHWEHTIAVTAEGPWILTVL